MSTLHASNILIVGGTSGIGFAIAKQLLDHHVETLIVASSTKAKVDDAVSKLTSIVSSKDGSGVKIVGEVVDAGNSQSVRDLLARIGEIDHLVWTAGDKSLPRDFRSTNVDNAKNVFDVRFWGVVVAAQEAKFKAGGSLILTTGSPYKKPPIGMAIGAGIAGSIDALTRGLAKDLAPIRVNAVSAGLVSTELWDFMPQAAREKFFADFATKLPLGFVADADDVASTYVYLMGSRYITGQTIDVDGGLSLIR